MEHLLNVIIGIFVGMIGTLIGAGGGFILIPYLILVAKFSPQTAAGTSLFMVFFNALSGSIAYIRQKRVDFRTAFYFALATIPGAIFGAYLNSFLHSRLFNVLFALLLFFLAVRTFFHKTSNAKKENQETKIPGHETREIIDAEGNKYEYSFNLWLGIGISLIVGILSSLLGIGGGIIHVPLMGFLGFPMHIATATSHFILVITSLIGVTSHIAYGHVVFPKAIAYAIGAIIGAQIGARISAKISGSTIKKGLAVALALVAVRLLTL
ncbi:sulfite exporter TauE/SafE family protein [Carboxydothermus ferrireducens]|uniref:Probable membrane transporter protein n=1 Tax=Carboxydothermus ferrireducens DSM 11255 TaxID=1119529 RepID=A0ABX2R9E6_9THEO|nr:sulfite exporter TauE/SafE family protein [Carboxydothermus ferrireducens]NYE57801.1 hypothetical protein [Carboxydothermus ferrireducens DSM 11255]